MLHHLPFLRSGPSNKPLQKIAMNAKARNLAQARSGQRVTIAGFGNLSPAHLQHLQAYGLLPGRTVVVLAQQPVTIVMIEHTELAFEGEIACQVLVE